MEPWNEWAERRPDDGQSVARAFISRNVLRSCSARRLGRARFLSRRVSPLVAYLIVVLAKLGLTSSRSLWPSHRARAPVFIKKLTIHTYMHGQNGRHRTWAVSMLPALVWFLGGSSLHNLQMLASGPFLLTLSNINEPNHKIDGEMVRFYIIHSATPTPGFWWIFFPIQSISRW